MDDIRKTALIIEKIFGIKSRGMVNEFKQEFDKTLQNEYAAELEQLISLNQEDFELLIKSDKYNADKLVTLSQMLYVFAEPFEQNEETKQLLKKVIAILDVLEEKYHIQSFDNITRRNAIYKYFDITL
jgi:hypothetical protein